MTASAQDRTTRYFHTADGQLQGMLDASGALTEYLYDGAGRRIETIGYAALVTRAGDSVAALRPATSAQDIHQYAVYDRRGC